MPSTAIKIVLIIGLPGSGKTTLLKGVTKVGDWIAIDDIESLDQLPKVLDRNMAITSPHLCASWRTAVEVLNNHYPEAHIQKLFFENDVEAAYANVLRRKDGRKIDKAYISYLSGKYEIPSNANIIPIYRHGN